MYHIPEDRRAQRSAGLLYDGLIRCLKKKSLTDITVAEVVKSSGVSRATFYRLFDTIVDILTWRCEEIQQESMKRARMAEGMSHRSTFLFYASLWMENRDMLSALIANGRMDILLSVHESHQDEISEIFLSDASMDPIHKEYLSGMLTALMPVGFRICIQHPEYSMEELFDLLQESICNLEDFFAD